MHPFAPRRCRFHGVEHAGDWALKLYSISYDGAAVDWAAFEGGVDLALREMPAPAVSAMRPGAGFLIAHRGRDGLGRVVHYVVIAWWDHQNELPIKVFVRGGGERDAWRAALGESICVWDLEIIWREREAFVETLMGSPSRGVAAYLARAACEADGGERATGLELRLDREMS